MRGVYYIHTFAHNHTHINAYVQLCARVRVTTIAQKKVKLIVVLLSVLESQVFYSIA